MLHIRIKAVRTVCRHVAERARTAPLRSALVFPTAGLQRARGAVRRHHDAIESAICVTGRIGQAIV